MKGMVVRIKVSGFENENVEKLTLKEEKSGLLSVSTYLFNKVVDGERENVLMRLVGRFKGLRYEDLEEVYNDGCLVLWGKMMDKEFKLKEKRRGQTRLFFLFLDRIYKIDKIISFSSPSFENAKTLFPKSFIEAPMW